MTFYTGVCEASDLYLNQLDDVLNNVTASQVAGFFAEPIQVWYTKIFQMKIVGYSVQMCQDHNSLI